MVAPDTASEYDAYARRIERWEGVTVRERTNTGRNGHIIDFRFEWPGVPPVTPDERRYDDVRSSAVIWRKPEQVKNWQLRLAPLPVEGNPDEEAVKDILERNLFNGVRSREGLMVLMADGEQAWIPHVQPTGFSPAVRDPDTVLDTIHTVWTNYRQLADDNGVIR